MSLSTSGSAIVPKPIGQINPNYLVRIWGTDEQGNYIGGSQSGIIAAAPEEFSIDVSSEWTPILSALAEQNFGILGGTTQKIFGALNTAAQALGYTAANVAMTQQVWNGTSPIELKLPIKFNAVTDARNEVTLPILYLLSLCLPSEASAAAGQFSPLHAPGPTINQSGSYNVKISVGRLLIFQNVIVTGVSAVFTTLPTVEGDYIAADVDLSIRTGTILTKNALANMFRNVSLGGLSGSNESDSGITPTTPQTGSVNPNNITTPDLSLYANPAAPGGF